MLTVSEDKMMKAVCCAMPSGETLWFNAEEGSEYLSKVIKAWKDQHPEYANTESTMGVIEIRMPEDKFFNTQTTDSFEK